MLLIRCLCVFFAFNLFAQISFAPPSTTPGGTPTLSISGNSNAAQIVTDSSGRYVYATWHNTSGANDYIQAARSVDFGSSWSLVLQTDGLKPQIATDASGKYVNICYIDSSSAVSLQQSSNYGIDWVTNPTIFSSHASDNPQIATNQDGRYIYVVWYDTVVRTLYFSGSSNFGVLFSNPLALDVTGVGKIIYQQKVITNPIGQSIYVIYIKQTFAQETLRVQSSTDNGLSWSNNTLIFVGSIQENNIAANTSGQYAYAIWTNKTTQQIQVSLTSNYGVTWLAIPINLTQAGFDVKNPDITTDSTGQYVYATWSKTDGSNYIIQVAISSDFGASWSTPQDLTATGQDADSCRISTDSTGKDVYVIWARKNDGSNYNIQAMASKNYGVTWINPITTLLTTTTPDLSLEGQDAIEPQIITNSSGQYIYAIWTRKNDGINYFIQTVNGTNKNKVSFPIDLFIPRE